MGNYVKLKTGRKREGKGKKTEDTKGRKVAKDKKEETARC